VSDKRGVYRKYEIKRTSPSKKHEDCDYFVLDLDHDPFALAALRAYAEACSETHPELAADLRAKCALMTDDPTMEELRNVFHRAQPDPWRNL